MINHIHIYDYNTTCEPPSVYQYTQNRQCTYSSCVEFRLGIATRKALCIVRLDANLSQCQADHPLFKIRIQ